MKKIVLALTAVAALGLSACGSDEKTVVVNPQQPAATVVTPPPANNTVVVPQSSAPGTKVCPSNTVC